MKNKLKKIFSVMACMVMVLVGGVSLAACGQDEFAGAEQISVAEMSTYLHSENVETSFNGYTMSIQTLGDSISASVAIVEEKMQASLLININETSENPAMAGSMYLLNEFAYIDLGNNQKRKIAYNPNDSSMEALKMVLEFASSSNLKTMIESVYTDVTKPNLIIKRLVEENKTKFLFEASQNTTLGTSVYSMKLVYENDRLVELSETVKIGKTVFSSTSIKAFEGAIIFPENLENDESYVQV